MTLLALYPSVQVEPLIPLPDSCGLAEFAKATKEQQDDYCARVRAAWPRWAAEDAKRKMLAELDMGQRDYDEDERGDFR